MKKLFISLLAAASLAAPALANKNPELAQSGGLTGGNVSSKTSDPEVKFYTPDATGCMILRECTDGVKQVFSILDVSSEYSDPDRFNVIGDEFNYMLMYLTQIGVEVFLADEKYFSVFTRGMYQTEHNRLFLNKSFMSRPSGLIAVMRHEGWHAAQDCMAGTIDNTFMAIIEPEEDVPQYWQDVVKKTYSDMPGAIPWEKEAFWAGHTEGMTLDALQACASPTPMWEVYEPTPLTRKWLVEQGFIAK